MLMLAWAEAWHRHHLSDGHVASKSILLFCEVRLVEISLPFWSRVRWTDGVSDDDVR